MNWKRAAAYVLALLFVVAPAGAVKVDREIVSIRTVELPVVSAKDLDYAQVRAEIAYGAVELGEPVTRTTKSICVPKGSKNALKDAIELPTHYYEIPYRVTGGVMIVRDGQGKILHSARLDALESSERFGYDQCRYWLKETLASDWEEQESRFGDRVEQSAREHFQGRAAAVLEDALFFNVVEEKIPVFMFKDKQHDYGDLNDAARLAAAGYAALDGSAAGQPTAGRAELEQAIAVWDQALEQSDLNDKTARVNRKVTVKLHQSVGVAWLMLGDPAKAMIHLEKANRYGAATSRSNGTGSADLLERAQRRKARAGRNAGLHEAPQDIDAAIRAGERYRGIIPIDVRPSTELARLESEHAAFTVDTVVELVESEQAEREQAIASGEVNPYERMVGRTSIQGFYLFLMPFPEKLTDFPNEVCDLTHLNQLRMANHSFDSVPEEIGKLSSLRVLDLSGNRIETVPESIGELGSLTKLNLSGNQIVSLPEAIGQLQQLKVLALKGNPLAPGEIERLQELLPKCKIKV